MYKIINTFEVCGIAYVDVMADHGPATLLKSQVDLVNTLHEAGLNDETIHKIMNLVADYAADCKAESEID